MTGTAARFAGRRVLVTGASRGLGRAIAEAFGSEGAHVGVAFRARVAEAEQSAAAVRAAGGSAEPVQFDVRDGTAADAAIRRFAAGGALDVLVNNAAVLDDQLFALMAQAAWDDVIATGLGGAYHCTRAAVPLMLARQGGAIVNVASLAGLRASPGQANYAAAKGGLIALTVTLAAELAPRGIRVNAVLPGLLATGMGERMDRRKREQRAAGIPLGRLGRGDEVARTVLFLASEDASYVVGQCLGVDGGLSL